jgi:hypothetical protein
VTVAQDTLERAVAELPGLDEMLVEFEHAPAIFQASDFWIHHNIRNLQQIADEGFDAFKRTVNTNYFQWEPGSPRGDGPRERVARRLLALWLRRPDPRVLRARLAEPRSSLHLGSAARWHAICVAILWEYARQRDPCKLLDYEEPELLRAVPGVRCIVCDIPPALAIAQRYLTGVFGELPTFRFRRFDDPAAVIPELERARLGFLLPHQLAALPALGADLFVNISSLHEMRHEQIANWFTLIDRHTRGRFYTKQWMRSVNVFDDLTVDRDDYPVPEHWRVLVDREVRATPGFFEAVYSVGPSPG